VVIFGKIFWRKQPPSCILSVSEIHQAGPECPVLWEVFWH